MLGSSMLIAVTVFIIILIQYACRKLRANSSVESESRFQSSPLTLPPCRVRATSYREDGSIRVIWFHPESYSDLVKGYEVRYKLRNESNFSGFYWSRPTTKKCTLTPANDGIKPLNEYIVEVRPIATHTHVFAEWASTTVYVDWRCQFPECNRNRRKRSDCAGTYSGFCSPEHAEIFSSTYCLYPKCTKKKRCNHFCSYQHLQKGTSEGICGLLKLSDTSQEYHNLTKAFTKNWSSKKGSVPRIHCVLEIVNPSIQNRLEEYDKTLSWWYQGIKQYYHGTQLKCNMLDYLELCTNANCSVCGIAKNGFDPKRISSNSWQRFGKGFYLAPNSSKSYEYPLAGRNQSTFQINQQYRCVLVCDVAPGCKYYLYENNPSLERPPSGYHSVYGKAKWLWFQYSPHLNYDELVVFDTNAIRPHYILFCENKTDN